jgi:hypothetical protein
VTALLAVDSACCSPIRRLSASRPNRGVNRLAGLGWRHPGNGDRSRRVDSGRTLDHALIALLENHRQSLPLLLTGGSHWCMPI